MLPSYTKPNVQSVQPGTTGAPAQAATPTGYATGANPITASRGAVADMTRAPAMPATPQVQSQPGIPQAWQSQQYMSHLQNRMMAPPQQSGLASLQVPNVYGRSNDRSLQGMTMAQQHAAPQAAVHGADWRSRAAMQQNANAAKSASPYSLYENPVQPPSRDSMRKAFYDRAVGHYDRSVAAHDQMILAPIRAKEEAKRAAEAEQQRAYEEMMAQQGNEDNGGFRSYQNTEYG